MAILSLAAATLPLVSAAPQSESLSRALDAFLNEDYSQIHIIARHADNGEPDAIAALGQAYLHGYGLAADPMLGIALLEQASRLGERSSAVRLGRAYEFGAGSIAVDTAAAAHWYVKAARDGDTRSAPAALRRLPREDVLAAGGAPWAGPAPAARAAPPDAQQQTAGIAASAVSPASALLGTNLAPPPIFMNDGTRFPLLADTQLSPIGDAVASCSVVVKPELEQQQATLESLVQLDNFVTGDAREGRHAALAEADRLVRSLTALQRAADSVLSDPARNGGLKQDDVRLALVAHAEALKHRPETGPGLSLCMARLVPLIGESVAWPAN